MAAIVIGLFIVWFVSILFPKLDDDKVSDEVIIYLEKWDNETKHEDFKIK